MNLEGAEFPFVESPEQGASGVGLAFLPIVLASGSERLQVMAMVDSGSTVNVLPHELGLRLGLSWRKQRVRVELTGNLAGTEARGVVLDGLIVPFEPVRLAFAWSKRTNLPVILGQMNFFLEFDVCFLRSRGVFEVKPKP